MPLSCSSVSDMEGSAEVSLQEVNTLVENYCDGLLLQPGDFEVLNYTVKSMSETPQGFLGEHSFLDIVIKKISSKDDEKIHLKYFVKKAPASNECFMKYVNDLRVFEKESNLFNQLIPRLQDINSKFGKFGPECFLIADNKIVFENLIDKGFRMGSSRDQLFDYSHLLCAMKTLANMHSASAMLEYKTQSRLTDLYPGHLKENSFPGWESDSARNQVLETGIKAVQCLIKQIPKYKESPELPLIVDVYEKRFRRLPEYCQPSKWFRNVLLHGDLWANNLMFNYDDAGRPVDCRVVDFQLSRYAPPVLDVMMLLTLATTSSFRKKHMTALMENYYHFVDDYMTAHGMDVDDVVTKLEFKECVSYYREAGLLLSCHVSHETLLPAEITTELFSGSEQFEAFYFGGRDKSCKKAFESDVVYRERMTDMIVDLVDNFILKENCEYNF